MTEVTTKSLLIRRYCGSALITDMIGNVTQSACRNVFDNGQPNFGEGKEVAVRGTELAQNTVMTLTVCLAPNPVPQLSYHKKVLLFSSFQDFKIPKVL